MLVHICSVDFKLHNGSYSLIGFQNSCGSHTSFGFQQNHGSHLVDGFLPSQQPFILLALIYLITMILTELSSNTATAIIMTPIVMAVTNQLGIDARPFIFAVCFAASASFSTPVGYQTNLMVYGPVDINFQIS